MSLVEKLGSKHDSPKYFVLSCLHEIISCLLLFSFTDIELRPDSGVPTETFLDACGSILPVFGKSEISPVSAHIHKMFCNKTYTH